ncbi:hypothetical protein ASE30_18655 [Achromobacter sp. Root83]|nr:hypothetical protein ASE30_18655 [Achromobacter sp. Root83]
MLDRFRLSENRLHGFKWFCIKDRRRYRTAIRSLKHPHCQLIFRRFKQLIEIEVFAVGKNIGQVWHR